VQVLKWAMAKTPSTQGWETGDEMKGKESKENFENFESKIHYESKTRGGVQ
jgi:hypothetical protein